MKNSNEVEFVFTPYITLKDGTKIFAKQYGKKAFCFPKKRKKRNQ